MRRSLRSAVALALCVLFAYVPVSAQAASGKCATSKGVTVVVDFGSLGGGLVVRCAENASGSGLAALHAAGFSTQGTIKDGPGFVCRINNLPSPAQESCQFTPKAGDNWSYWHASNGGSWSFSQAGAANRQIIQGGFEGWTFGGSPPAVAPARPAASESDSGSAPDDASDQPSADDSALPKPKPRDAKPGPLPTEVGSLAQQSGPAENPDPTGGSDSGVSDSGVSADSGGSATVWIAGGILAALAIGIAVAQRRRRA